jgi:ubiquinone/menaquinone biosynthesis C-methylase UbiE
MLKQLDNSQLENFDMEYIHGSRWRTVSDLIDQSFPSGKFTFLDVGGGNGKFADRLLAHYPEANGTVLDNAQILLDRNQLNPRKQLINASVADLCQHSGQTYDIICFNWLLHHLVSDSYAQTCRNISQTIGEAISLLSPQGRISIFENMYDGILFDRVPSRLIFELTSSKTLANFTHRMGANTAGIGVCFLSQRHWRTVISQHPLMIDRYTDEPVKTSIPLIQRITLHMRNVSKGHFWLRPMKQTV